MRLSKFDGDSFILEEGEKVRESGSNKYQAADLRQFTPIGKSS